MKAFAIIATIIALYVPSSNSLPFKALNDFYKNHRFQGAFLTCAIKGCSADLVAQSIANRREQKEEDEIRDNRVLTSLGFIPPGSNVKHSYPDLKRSLMFLIYGGFYQGMAQEFIYNDILPKLGRGTDALTVAKKVFVDMAFIAPLICVPIAYLVKGLLLGNSIGQSLQNYKSDVVNEGVIFKNWMIFVPTQCLTFSVVPEHLRVSFVACVSFFWMILLSCILSN